VKTVKSGTAIIAELKRTAQKGELMDDLINRQAAIDALNEVVKDHSITDFDAIASILGLPSADPLQGTQMSLADCISRQAAIDIADDLRDCITVEGYWAWTERLKKLPSAQPEIIRCKDCEEYQANFRWCKLHGGEFTMTDFCSFAERRTDA